MKDFFKNLWENITLFLFDGIMYIVILWKESGEDV